jgi:hypothetical protein
MVNKPRAALEPTRRTAERHPVALPGRVTWRDSRGMTRFASVVTRDVSDSGVYLECRGADAIPLYRLVYLQLERGTRELATLPSPLRDGRVLSAVYRVGPCEPTTGTPSGYALRLLVEPARRRAEATPALLDALHLERPHLYDTGRLGMDLAGHHGDDLAMVNGPDLVAAESLVV